MSNYDSWNTTPPVDYYAEPDEQEDEDCEPEQPEQDEPEWCISCGLIETRCVCGVGEYEAWKACQADMEAA